jgi:serine/threonine protein kinase
MLQKSPINRITAFEALTHPWLGLSGPCRVPSLMINFEEIGDANLTEDEPSLMNTVNIQLITTSPIWNKSKMREMLGRVN